MFYFMFDNQATVPNVQNLGQQDTDEISVAGYSDKKCQDRFKDCRGRSASWVLRPLSSVLATLQNAPSAASSHHSEQLQDRQGAC